MEDSAVRVDEAGVKASRNRRALAAAGLTPALVLAAAALGGSAQAQDPVYEIPTPTPTGTPFSNPQPSTPQQPQSGPRLMRPFPKVRTAGSYTRRRTRFTRVIVKAPAGARIDARCSRRRCKPTTRSLTRDGKLRLRRLQRNFKSGTKITIRITGADVIGKHVQIRTRRGEPPRRRDRCLEPGRTRPVVCESP